jgi:hypothetical protein
MLNLLGLVDAKNAHVAVLHYTVPAVILLYFVVTSSIPRTPPSVPIISSPNAASTSHTNGTSTMPAIRTTQSLQSSLLKWLFVLAILTFVSLKVQEFD